MDSLFKTDISTRSLRDPAVIGGSSESLSPGTTKKSHDKIKIAPNLAAVSRNRSMHPIKGLAYKEAKQRLNSKLPAAVASSMISYDSMDKLLEASLQPTTMLIEKKQRIKEEENRGKKRRTGKLCKGLSMKSVQNKKLCQLSSSESLYASTSPRHKYFSKSFVIDRSPLDKSTAAPPQSLVNEQQFSRINTTPNTCSTFKI